jgi:Ni,Fe-hydrogenase I small subunit
VIVDFAVPDLDPAAERAAVDKPIIKAPGCPPIAEVMTGVITFINTFASKRLDGCRGSTGRGAR